MSAQELFRVYADAKHVTPEGDYILSSSNAERDLDAIDDGPREGMRLMLDVQYEFEVQAVLKRSVKLNCWIASPDAATRRQLEADAT